MARTESNSRTDADEQSASLSLIFKNKQETMALISDHHLLYLILVIGQGEVDVSVHAAELDGSLVIGPAKHRPEKKAYFQMKTT
jgi:hypothetical protein